MSADGWLDPAACFGALAELKVTIPEFRYVRDRHELTAALEQVGFPMVLKADAEGALHKSDAGALALDLRSAKEAEATFDRFVETFGSDLHGVLVQHQLKSGLELLVGLNRSERFGPLLVVGSGGTAAELIADREVLVAPATRTDISDALDRLRLAPLLHGDFRHPGVDIEQLIDIAYQIGMLADGCPELVEVDLNPVMVSSTAAIAVDVRMRLVDEAEPVMPLRGMRPARVR